MEGLHIALKEALTKKLFFIVLDDVWEEDRSKWESLKGLLNCGRKGSTVIVTTRSDRVSEIVGTLQNCHPQYLSKDESWDLFSKRAFAPGAEKPEELVEIGKAIASMCRGLPLAIRMLGSLLYMKRDKSQWLKIKDSKVWNTETGILPALRLSYKHLPPHSKRCFTFCAIFPKDYEMEKEMLINMWMAHGFIPSDGGSLEDKGNEIFSQLVQRSFLQDLKEEIVSYRVQRTTCRMHDLIHDLALSIVGNVCVALQEESSKVAVIKDAYHLSISILREFDIEYMLKASPYLRTILFTLEPWKIVNNINMNVSSSTFLRLVTLNARSLTLPSSMKHLQHLRYLGLRKSGLSELPESICTLLNLQTLDLFGCWELHGLPKRMPCMIGLRHLYLDNCYNLEEMAPGMGRMTNLQTLTLYVVGEEPGRGIGELKTLHLSSRLVLRNLGSTKDAKEAREVNLHSKDLNFLSLCWRTGGEEEMNTVEQVLEELKPPSCLKVLEIIGYEGLTFPTWMADRLLLQQLVKLRLHHCTRLHRLPPLWQLSSLDELSLYRMNNLKYIISDNTAVGHPTVQAFRSLKILELEYLGSLEGWWENENAPLPANWFSSLVRLGIFSCRKLTCTIPSAPCLESFRVRSIKKIHVGSLSALTSLVSLTLTDCGEEAEEQAGDPVGSFLSHESVNWGHDQQHEEESSGHSSLKDLTISECEDWIFSSPGCFGFWTSMTSLESLRLYGCHTLIALPCQVLQGLKSLRRLEIEECHNMTGQLSGARAMNAYLLPRLEEMRFRHLALEAIPPIWGPSLKKLSIVECRKLASLAASEQDLSRLTSLEHIIVADCPSLASLVLDGLTALRNLRLEYCVALASVLPARAVLPTLQELTVMSCPQLEKKCTRGHEYWNLISNIPNCEIKSAETR